VTRLGKQKARLHVHACAIQVVTVQVNYNSLEQWKCKKWNCMHRDEEKKPGGGNNVDEDGNGVRSQWCWWRWRGRWQWFTVVMTVAGGVCCSFSSSSPCRDTFLVCFCLVLLLLVSGGGGAAGGFQTMRWRLLAGGIAMGVLFSFLCWSILLSQWRRCSSGGEEDQLWFSFFLPSSSVTFFPRLSVSVVLVRKTYHPLFSPSPFVLSFPFCRSGFTPPVFSSVLSPPPSLFSPAFGSSSGFYSQRTRVFLVSQRASRWRGLSAAIRSLLDLETRSLSLPTSPSFIITEYQLLQKVKWWKRRHLGFFWFGHWMFCSFVIKSSIKL